MEKLKELSQEEKQNLIKKEFEKIGIPQEGIKEIMKNNLDDMTINGKKVKFKIKDVPENRELLDKHGLKYSPGDNNTLIAELKIIMQEGWKIKDTSKNRNLLDDNGVNYTRKDDNMLFVSKMSKKALKMATLYAFLSPIGAVAMIYAFKLTKDMSDKVRNESKNENNLNKVIYRDKYTGNINSIPTNEIKIPKRYSDHIFTQKEMSELRVGNPVTLEKESNISRGVIVDISSKEILKGVYREKEKDKYIRVPSKNSSTEEILKYVQLTGKKGIDDVFGRDINNMERFFDDNKLDSKMNDMEIKEMVKKQQKNTTEEKKHNGLKL